MNLLWSVMKKKCLALIEKKKCTNMHINQNQNFLLTWQDAWKVSKWFWNAFFVYGTVWHWTGPCYFLLKNKPLFNIYNLWDWYFFDYQDCIWNCCLIYIITLPALFMLANFTEKKPVMFTVKLNSELKNTV